MAASRARRVMSVIAGIVFAVFPWLTLGFGTPLALGVAAGIMRSRLLVLAALGSAGVMVMLIAVSDPDHPLFSVGMVANIVGGGVLTAIVTGPFVRALRGPPAARGSLAHELAAEVDQRTRAELVDDPLVRQALAARSRRAYAREILARDPALATELGIGRPDLGQGFEDGGLVDVNGAPVAVLASLPGFDQAMAERWWRPGAGMVRCRPTRSSSCTRRCPTRWWPIWSTG